MCVCVCVWWTPRGMRLTLYPTMAFSSSPSVQFCCVVLCCVVVQFCLCSLLCCVVVQFCLGVLLCCVVVQFCLGVLLCCVVVQFCLCNLFFLSFSIKYWLVLPTPGITVSLVWIPWGVSHFSRVWLQVISWIKNKEKTNTKTHLPWSQVKPRGRWAIRPEKKKT